MLTENKTFLSGMTPTLHAFKAKFLLKLWVKRLNLSKGILGRRQRTERIGKTDYEKKKIKNF